MKNALICIVSLVVISLSANSQTSKWVRYNTQNSNIPDNHVHAIAIESTGVVWLGTDSGLTRFDGVRWKKFEVGFDFQNGSYHENPVRAIAIDKMGNVWVGTDNFLSFFFNSTKFICIPGESKCRADFFELSEYGPVPYKVGSILADQMNNIWIGYSWGIARMSLPQVMDTITKSLLYGYSNKIPLSNLNTLHALQSIYPSNPTAHPIIEDNSGNIWAGFRGLKKIKDEIRDFDLSEAELLPNETPMSLETDQRGNLWIGDLRKGLLKFDGVHLRKMELPDPYLAAGGISDIKVDPRGNIWVGTEWRLLRFDGTSEACIVYDLTNGNTPFDLNSAHDPANNVNAIVFDTNGDIWIGTDDGVVVQKSNVTILNRENSPTSEWVELPGPKRGDAICFASNPDSPDKLFLGTAGEGVFLSTDDGSSWEQINTGLTNLDITSLAYGGQDLFAGTLSEGVFRLINNGTKWYPMGDDSLRNTVAVHGLAASSTYVIQETMWGVYVSTDKGTSWHTIKHDLLSEGHNRVFAISGSNIFTGTSVGVLLLTNSGASWSVENTGIINKRVSSLATNGSSLFAATSGGVLLSTNSGKDWSLATHGLPDTTVTCFAFAGPNIFAGTPNGAFLSKNKGSNWIAVNAGLMERNITSLVVADKYLFAATSDGTIWRRPLSELLK